MTDKERPMGLIRNGGVPVAAAILIAGGLIAADRSLGQGGDRSCPASTADLGTICISQSLQGRGASYFDAARACSRQGGQLPTADQLIGAADRLSLAGRLDDDPATATLEPDSGRGRHDLRELTATLITTRSGSGAAGSLGSSEQAKGDPAIGEPDPAPAPADTAPSSLQYVTVIDNGNRGGFAGALPVSDPSPFRCAFNKQGTSATTPAPATRTAPALPAVNISSRVALTALGHSGVTATVACPRDCTYIVSLEVPAATARRLGLTTSRKKPAVLATNGSTPESLNAGGSARVRLKPRPGAISRMRYWLGRLHLSSVRADVRLTAQQDGGARRSRVVHLTMRR
jgi:hypothetical protein